MGLSSINREEVLFIRRVTRVTFGPCVVWSCTLSGIHLFFEDSEGFRASGASGMWRRRRSEEHYLVTRIHGL